MSKPNQEDCYWAAIEDAKEFAAAFFKRINTQGTGWLNYLQWLSHQHYYAALPVNQAGWNQLPSSAQLSREGPEGSNTSLTVNWFRSNVNAQHQVVVAPELAVTATPTNTDARSQADADRGSSILDYQWKSTEIAQQAKSAQLGSVIYGEEFLHTFWNPVAGQQIAYDQESGTTQWSGQLEVENVASWDCARDTTVKSYPQSKWRGVRRYPNKWNLIAQYPEQKDEILKAHSASTSIAGMLIPAVVTDSDVIPVWYLYHSKTPALPQGLQAIIVSEDLVLSREPLEPCYEHLPVHRCASAELKGTPFAYSNAWEAMGPQDLATDVQGSLATNIVTFGRQMISAEDDTDLNFNSLGEGPSVVYRKKGTAPPTPLQLTASPAEAFQHLARLRGDMREIFGLNDLNYGQAPTGALSGVALALLASSSITNNSDAQRAYVGLVTSTMRSMLAIYKAKATWKQKVAIVGVHGASVPRQDEFDKTDFEGIDDVSVTIASPLAQTAAGRVTLAEMEMKAGFVKVPEQLDALLTTGDSKPMTQILRDQRIYITSENEMILQGICPPVKVTDDHQLHMREHVGPTFSAEARAVPGINIAADAHIKKHLFLWLNSDPRLLAALGQAAPPQQAPQGPGPQGGPPASPPSHPPSDGPAGPAAGPARPSAPMESPLMAQQGKAADVRMPNAPNNPLTGQPFDPKTGGLQ